jgi:3-oxoadipate enol-lactonase
MAFIELESGLIIYYLDLNPSGAPIVLLLHGLGATGDSWQLQYPPLIEAGYRVLVPDMRGFGRSNYPGGRNNPEIMATDSINLLKRLEICSCHIVGISMGGTIALHIVLKEQSLVESVILTNTFARLRPKNPATWIFYGLRFLLVNLLGVDKQANYVAGRLFPHPEQEILRSEFTKQVRQANQTGYRSTMRSYANFDLSNRLQEIKVPTQVITAENDTVVPPATQVEMSDNIPNSRQIFIPPAGHAVTVEKPDMYNKIILEFLDSNQESLHVKTTENQQCMN